MPTSNRPRHPGSILLRACAKLEGLIVRPLKMRFRAGTFIADIKLTPRNQVSTRAPTETGEPTDRPEVPRKNIEEAILDAVGDRTMYAKEIARLTGYAHSSHLKQALAKLVRERRLEKTPDGYQRRPDPSG